MEPDIPHEHCDRCFKQKCKEHVLPPIGCAMTDCDNECGARFHQCKSSEHTLLCPNERVNCINCENGCPIVIPRWQLGKHLQTCPASVVICTMEWNRWPVFSRERQSKLPFTQHQMHLRYGQLDVALAMRDQRMLNESMKAPRKTRRTLRNNLTRRFPAVPIVCHRTRSSGDIETETSAETSRTVSDDDSDAPWERAKMPPGLARSVCHKIYRATIQATESLSQAIDAAMDQPHDSALSNIPEFSNIQNGSVSDDACVFEVEVEPESVYESYDLCQGEADTIHTDSDMMASYSDVPELQKPRSVSPEGNQSLVSPSETSVSLNPTVPAPPDLGLFLNELLGLDLNVESITRYQAKPRSMYTFLCLQEFRRDEYTEHFRNVHGSIQSGLNGWMEQRCPLSQYGCTHSFRRFYPKPEGSITHSSLLESFGLQPHVAQESFGLQPLVAEDRGLSQSPSVESIISRSQGHSRSPSKSKESTPEVFTSHSYDVSVILNKKSQVVSPTGLSKCLMSLTSLPFEVLRYIGGYLDGFSLNNLSLTCHLLRDVCSSLLEDRGIVIQQWERVKEDGHYKWHIAYQRWFFSVCFSPVQDWGFADFEPLGEHLKVCPFNKRNTKTEPYQFPMGCEDVSQEIVEKLFRNARTEVENGEGVGTRLDTGDGASGGNTGTRLNGAEDVTGVRLNGEGVGTGLNGGGDVEGIGTRLYGDGIAGEGKVMSQCHTEVGMSGATRFDGVCQGTRLNGDAKLVQNGALGTRFSGANGSIRDVELEVAMAAGTPTSL